MVKYIIAFFTLVVSYITLGRKGAVPIGLALFSSGWLVFINMLIIEFVQIPLFYFLLGPLASRLSWVIKLKQKFATNKAKITEVKLFKYAQKIGVWGVFFVVVIPAGTGGVLGGVILTKLLNINYYKGIISIIFGILICNFVLVVGIEGIKQLVFLLIRP